MINQSTIDTLKQMRFSAKSQLSDPDTYSSLGFEERIALLVDAEWNRRQANKLAKCIRDAGFSAPNACMEEIEYHPDRKLDKTQLTRFSRAAYHPEWCLRQRQDVHCMCTWQCCLQKI